MSCTNPKYIKLFYICPSLVLRICAEMQAAEMLFKHIEGVHIHSDRLFTIILHYSVYVISFKNMFSRLIEEINM